MNQYEIMYVIDTQLEETARAALIERFAGIVTTNNGVVDRIDEWGKRRLAYAINYKTEGYYVLMYVTAPSELPREIERNLQISEDVLRYLVIRFEGTLPPKREPLKPFTPHAAAQTQPAEGAPVAAEAPAEEAAQTPAEEPDAQANDAEPVVEV